jgi:GR25 family glycosyltransferase involved in LPS biosynthesis
MLRDTQIVCINLENRPDKLRQVQKTFQNIGIEDQVSFFTAQKSSKGGLYGCMDSHIQVIHDAYKDGWDFVVIFEDDVVTTPYFSMQRFHDALSWHRQHQDTCDILFLGHFPFHDSSGSLLPYAIAPFLPFEKNFVKFSPTGTHAYCVSRVGMEKIINSDWKYWIGREHYDVFLAKQHHINSICYVPCLFAQYSCLGTDNTANSRLESFARNFQCYADISLANYNISLWKFYSKYFYIISFFFIVSLVIFILFQKVLYIKC